MSEKPLKIHLGAGYPSIAVQLKRQGYTAHPLQIDYWQKIRESILNLCNSYSYVDGIRISYITRDEHDCLLKQLQDDIVRLADKKEGGE